MSIRRAFALVAASSLAVATLFAPGAASASGGATEHLLILSSDPSDAAIPVVVATGPIHALGTDVTVTSHKDRFEFPRGTITVLHFKTKGTARNTFDPATCTGTHTEKGTFQVPGGTGDYANARGAGTYKLSVIFVGCSQSAPPQFFQLRVDASGPLSLGH